ncbi:MAG: DUF3127 domain-containing protein, partial [Chitinophagales bacterium]
TSHFSNMALEITGKIYSVLPEQNGQGQNGPWVKQTFVIETSDRFPKKICLQAWNEKGEMVTRLKQGDEVKVAFDLESREFNGKWYTDAKVWKLELVNQAENSNSPAASGSGSMEEPPPAVSDDLPF